MTYCGSFGEADGRQIRVAEWMGPDIRELVRNLHRDVWDGDSHVLDIQETP